MRLLKQALAVFGTVLLFAVILTIVTPKAAHAVVATLVEVANTSANPVAVTQGAELATEPFATMLCEDDSSGSLCAGTGAVLEEIPPSSFTVPSTDSAGHPVKALVIQFVSGQCNAAAVALVTTVPANGVNGVTKMANILTLVAQPSVSGTSTTTGPNVDQMTSIVAGPGSTVSMLAAFPPTGAICELAVNGYLAH